MYNMCVSIEVQVLVGLDPHSAHLLVLNVPVYCGMYKPIALKM